MTCYSIEPRDQIFVKGYRFLSLAKTMSKNIGKNIGKNLSSKYGPSMLAYTSKTYRSYLNSLLQKQLVI